MSASAHNEEVMNEAGDLGCDRELQTRDNEGCANVSALREAIRRGKQPVASSTATSS